MVVDLVAWMASHSADCLAGMMDAYLAAEMVGKMVDSTDEKPAECLATAKDDDLVARSARMWLARR